jgi:hypothetical protein
MTILYIRESQVAEYHAQGWICYRLSAHHGARRGGHNFICVR